MRKYESKHYFIRKYEIHDKFGNVYSGKWAWISVCWLCNSLHIISFFNWLDLKLDQLELIRINENIQEVNHNE